MIGYNIISPPIHDPLPPLPKIWGSRLHQPPRIGHPGSHSPPN